MTSISPISLVVGSVDTSVTVTGSNFVQATSVQWNGSPRPTTYVSNTQLLVSIPASDMTSAGSAAVTVRTPAPGGGTSAAVTMTVAYPLPVVSSLTPSSAVLGTGAFLLTINGSNFVPGATVYWNNVSRVTTFVSSTQVVASILAGDIAKLGTVSITVQNPSPSLGISEVVPYVVGYPVPQVLSVDPMSGTAGALTKVDILGTGFTAGSVARLGTQSQSTSYVSDTHLTAVISTSTIGTFSLSVFTPALGGGVSNQLTFEATPAGPGMQLTVVSVDPGGKVLNKRGSISANGRFVAFSKFLRDTCLTAQGRCNPSSVNYPDGVSAAWTGPPTNDGRYIALTTIIAPGNYTDADLRFVDTCFSSAPTCVPATKVLVPAHVDPSEYRNRTGVTPDGRYVGYLNSKSSRFDMSAVNYIFDTCVGAAQGCTQTSIPIGTSARSAPRISADARYSVYLNWTGSGETMVLHDSCLGAAPGCVPFDTEVTETNLYSFSECSISGDAQYVTYSYATSSSSPADIYLRSTCAGQSSCTSTTTQVTSNSPGQGSLKACVSSGGRFVTYEIAGSATNGRTMVYVYDSCIGASSGCTTRSRPLCLTSDGTAADADCELLGASMDGKYVLFYSSAGNLSPGADGATYVVANPLYE